MEPHRKFGRDIHREQRVRSYVGNAIAVDIIQSSRWNLRLCDGSLKW